MQKEMNGFVRSAFYMQNDKEEPEHLLWHCTQGTDTDLYEYHINDKNEICITEKEYVLQ